MEDSNLRSVPQRIYSPPPLTTRENPLYFAVINGFLAMNHSSLTIINAKLTMGLEPATC